MRIEAIDFPEHVLSALRADRLAIFAGAGVSMGSPANLPNFSELAQAMARGTGRSRAREEPIDRFLGQLALQGVDVQRRAVMELSRESLLPTPLHHDLLRCFPVAGGIRIVTTNFDLLFEQAAQTTLADHLDVYTSPALPLGTSFRGIVHIHGSVERPADIVLTDADFGRAYLTQGWARRFLVDLFNTFTVLFVGYSHDDIVMSYLARALPATDPTRSDVPRRYALAPETDDEHWEFLGISPIRYPVPAEGDHSALGRSVEGLARYLRRDFREWQRIIWNIAGRSPPSDQQDGDLIADSLADPARTRFFTEAAKDPEWIAWLDERSLLDTVFQADLSGDARQTQWLLSRWLCATFARSHAQALIGLFTRHGMLLNSELWLELERVATSESDGNWDSDVLSRWLSLLLRQIPSQVQDLEFHLLRLAQAAAVSEMDEVLLAAFDSIVQTCLSAEHSTDGEDWALNEAWRLHVSPLVNRATERLLAVLLHRLRERHRVLAEVQPGTETHSSDVWRRPAIEGGGEETEYMSALDVIINATRDSLVQIVQQNPEIGSIHIDLLIREESPLLRRIALYCAGIRNDLSADQKLDWLVKHVDFHERACQPELLWFLERTYGEASADRRESVLSAVDRYPDDVPEYEGRELYVAHAKMNLLTWLGRFNPQCSATTAAIKQLQTKTPGVGAYNYPTDSASAGQVTGLELQSPWSIDELLAQPADTWVPQLVAYRENEPFEPNRLGLLNGVREAVKLDFEWGVALGSALAAGQHWDTELWRVLFDIWTGELDQAQYLKVITLLDDLGVCAQCPQEISRVLVRLVENGGTGYAPALLGSANELAGKLWPFASEDANTAGMPDWYSLALNSAAGRLTEFWLSSLSIGLRDRHLEPGKLAEPCRTAFENMLQNATPAGTKARAMLMSRFAFLLHVDESWTREHLVPLLVKHPGADDFQAAWDGLMYGQLTVSTIEVLTPPFLCAAGYVQGFKASHTRKRFIECLTRLLIDYVEDPIEDWIPTLLEGAGPAVRSRFAWAIWKSLGELSDAEQQTLWNRWLRRYWENRVDGVPAPLEDFEVEWMLNWLAEFHSLFVEAVKLALRMPAIPVQASMLVRRLKDGEHCEHNPDAVADLLIWVVDSGPSTPPLFDLRALLEKLTQSDLNSDRKDSLEELRVRLGID